MKIELTYADGRVEEVHVIPSARRAFEAEHEQSLPDAMVSGRSDWADFVAWKTLQLRQNETRDLDDWLVTVDSLKVQIQRGGGDDEGPTGDEATVTPAASSKPREPRRNSKR